MKMTLTNAVFLSLFLGASLVQAQTYYKPYCKGDVAAEEVNAKLEAEKFQIVGEYEPYAGAKVIVVTNDTLKETATKSVNGSYGAVMRVAITDGVVSYTNPPYWANGYRMATNLEDVKTALEKALGECDQFGSKKGLTKDELRDYNYKPGMAKFDDPIDLLGKKNSYDSYAKGVEIVEAGLKSEKRDKGNTKYVYRVDIPGKDETVFGMGVLGDCKGADEKIMKVLNDATGTPKHTAYMPYEILVSGTKAYAFNGKFRIAISFPDLSMWTFGKIMTAPGCIEDAAEAAAKP